MKGSVSIEFLRELVDVTIMDPDFQPKLSLLQKQIIVEYVSCCLEQEFQGHRRRKNIDGHVFKMIHDNPFYKLKNVNKQFDWWLNSAEEYEDKIINYLVVTHEGLITDAMKKNPKLYPRLVRELWKAITSRKFKSYMQIAKKLKIDDDKLNLLRHRLIYFCFEIYKQTKGSNN